MSRPSFSPTPLSSNKHYYSCIMCWSVQDAKQLSSKIKGSALMEQSWWEGQSVSSWSELQRGKDICWEAGPGSGVSEWSGKARLRNTWGHGWERSRNTPGWQWAVDNVGKERLRPQGVQRPRGDRQLGTKRWLPLLEVTEEFEARELLGFAIQYQDQESWGALRTTSYTSENDCNISSPGEDSATFFTIWGWGQKTLTISWVNEWSALKVTPAISSGVTKPHRIIRPRVISRARWSTLFPPGCLTCPELIQSCRFYS